MAGGASITPLPVATSEDFTYPGEKKIIEFEPPEKKIIEFEPPEPKETTSQWEAAASAAAQGVTFGLADNITAAVNSAMTGIPYEEAFKKEQERLNLLRKEWPKTSYGTEGVAAAATMLIPGIGAIGRTAQIANLAREAKIAKDALSAAKIAGDTVKAEAAASALASARSAMTGELARGGVQTGLLYGAGQSQANPLKEPGTFARDVALSGITSGVTSVAIPKAAEKLLETKAGQKASEIASAGFEKVKDVASQFWKGKRWQLFPTRPDEQAVVDKIVKDGEAAGLTDTEILTQLKVKYGNLLELPVLSQRPGIKRALQPMYKRQLMPSVQKAREQGKFAELPLPSLTEDDFQKAFKEGGLAGSFKRLIAGSQEAAEFLNRPEQLTRAKAAEQFKTAEEQATQNLLQSTQSELTSIKEQRPKVIEPISKKIEALKQERDDILTQIRNETDTTKHEALQKEAELVEKKIAAEKQLTAYETFKQELEQQSKLNKEAVQNAIDASKAGRTQEQLQNVKTLRANLGSQVDELVNQRSKLIDNLGDKPATEAHLNAVATLRGKLQDFFNEKGMGVFGRRALREAFSGDKRFAKLDNWMKLRTAQDEYDRQVQNLLWNIENGYMNQYGQLIKSTGLRLNTGERYVDPAVVFGSRPKITPEQEPSLGELVGGLYAANKKISSAAHGTPIANVKREVGEIIQESMKDLSPEVYTTQRQIADTMADKTTLERKFFGREVVPKTGSTGRTAPVGEMFRKGELPDLRQKDEEYLNVLKKVGVDVDTINEIHNTKSADQIIKEANTTKSAVDIDSLVAKKQKELEQLDTAKRNLQRELENKKYSLAEKAKTVESEYSSKIKDQKNYMESKTKEIDDIINQIEGDVVKLRDFKSQLGETDTQLIKMLRQTEGLPVSGRDVAQAGTIASQGMVPWIAGKFMPSAKQRITLVNKIRTRFNNPSLTSAVRVLIDRPITSSVIRSLSETHDVSEPLLRKELEDAGIQIQNE